MANPGEPMAFLRAMVDVLQTDPGPCVIWPFGMSGIRPHVKRGGRMHPAAVVVAELAFGPMPVPGMYAAHAPIVCHEPRCVRPSHLRWATASDNSADRIMDETVPCTVGESNGNAKLTADQVMEIRNRWAAGGVTQRALAAEFGVTPVNVHGIVHGRLWRHLPVF
jgi:hypothetical protein